MGVGGFYERHRISRKLHLLSAHAPGIGNRLMAATSYDGHPGRLTAIIIDNLARCHAATSTHEIAERIRAHCDFIRTSMVIHANVANRIRANHPELNFDVPNDLG